MHYTKRQMEILRFVLSYQKEHGISPLLEEIATHFGVSTVTIFEHLVALEKKGAIVRKKHAARSIEIIDPSLSTGAYNLPLLGVIAAGSPIEAIESAETFNLTDMVPLDGRHYVLRVRGNSMVDEGINDGDYVIVREAKMAHNGQTVVAIIDGDEATLKKFYHEGNRIRLEPANEALEPIVVQDCEIRGVVVGVFRKYPV
jgi:repressor LexA